MAVRGKTGALLVAGLLAAGVALAVAAHWFAPQRALPAVHGARVEGGIAYAGAPIGDVLADVELYSGLRVQTAPGVAARRFTGTLNFSGQGEQIARRLAVQAGLGLRQSGADVVLEAKAD